MGANHFHMPSSSHSLPASFPVLAIAMVGITATAFLLVCYYIFVIKCCWTWRSFGYLTRFTSSGGRRRRGSQPLIFYTEYTHNHGLDETIIRDIPTFRWKRGSQEQGKAFSECAVCLCEFWEDEMLRLLPNCNHGFHVDCIDTWLQGNANCPLCRSTIAPFQLHYPVFSSSDGDIVIEIGNVGLDQAAMSSSVGAGNSLHANSEPDQWEPSPKKLEQRLQSREQRRLERVSSSKGDECIDVRRNLEDEFCVQPIRRSFSMDSSTDKQLYLSVQRVLQKNPQLLDETASSSDAGTTASRFRRSVFSLGHIRGSKNAILPVQNLA